MYIRDQYCRGMLMCVCECVQVWVHVHFDVRASTWVRITSAYLRRGSLATADSAFEGHKPHKKKKKRHNFLPSFGRFSILFRSTWTWNQPPLPSACWAGWMGTKAARSWNKSIWPLDNNRPPLLPHSLFHPSDFSPVSQCEHRLGTRGNCMTARRQQ